MNPNFYPWILSESALLKTLNTSIDGLTDHEVTQRIKEYGRNVIEDKSKRSALKIFLSQFESWLIVILVLATGVSFILGEQLDAIIVLSIIFLSVIFGFIQEYKAESVVKKLKELVTNKAKVLRSGKWQEIGSGDLVIGDIVKLNIGDRVPADIRLLEVDNFQIDESLLTGESKTVSKHTKQIADKNAQVYEKTNLAFSGSFVASGTAVGCVVAIGANTEIGKTAQSLAQKELHSDFQKQINKFSQFLLRIVIILSIFVFGSNALLNKGILDSLLFAVALAVGIAPELLPMIITVTLSRGALKMAEKKVIVKKLIAVEDFGNIDTLCSDKTGTLTEGIVSLAGFQNIKKEVDEEILKLGLLCSSGFTSRGKVSANPIDQALWAHVSKEGRSFTDGDFEITDENEFDFKRRMMSVVIKQKEDLMLIAKGAPESILEKCKLTSQELSAFQKLVQQYQSDGSRVLAVATKAVQKEETTLDDEKDLKLAGWLLFNDPIKKTAKETLAKFNKLGVHIKIISGDAPEVVIHAASQVGLEITKGKVITGQELEGISDSELAVIAQDYNFFARVNPEQKYRLVASLNKEGHIVGYLGDGINDAPAIKAADVGIAVDSGAEIAKDAADIILLEKDLHILADGILQGRKTFGNITKYILNTISANYGNMFTVALSSLFLPFIPLLPKQILLTNFISDIPLLTIATDNVDYSYTRKPKRWDIKLIGKFMLFFGLISSVFDFATILPLIFIWKVSPEAFRTGWFIESSLSEMIVTFAIRTRLPFYKSKPSLWLLGSSIISGLIVIGITLVSAGGKLFEFSRLPVAVYLWIATILIGYFISTEILKHFFFKKFDPENSIK